MNDHCRNPFCRRPIKTEPTAVWQRITCSDECRNMLSAVRRVAGALFPGLPAEEAIKMLLASAQRKNGQGTRRSKSETTKA
jgi:hypothetical protein